MKRGRLEDRIRELLLARSIEAGSDVVLLLTDFCQALVTGNEGVTCAEPAKFQALAGILSARTGLPQAALVEVVRLGLAPGMRETHAVEELSAFEARFGGDVRASLVADDAPPMDLASFSRVYGSADAMMLLEALLVVASSARGIDPRILPSLRSAGDALGVDGKLFGALLRRHDPRHARGEYTFPLKGDELNIGRSPGNEIVLLDPQVAPRHARLLRVEGGGWRVVDAGSGRPTVLDGQAVRAAPFAVGQRLRLGPYTLSLAEDGNTLVAEGSQSFSALSVRHVQRQIGDIQLLSDVGFTVFSGEVIAVVGPSGSGKTTLLNAITGIAPPDTGEILLDGADFHHLLRLDRSMVGIVPQDDLVHPELTVRESLRYAARLRFPADVTSEEIEQAVERVLKELDIQHIGDRRIGDVQRRGISGGQRKRVNLGQELLTRSTRVLFLDEPTSGLDPRAAQDIMRLARRLADDGRIVFIVTHDMTPAILSQVDHLLVLAPGGHLAFFGPRAEACQFFKVPSPDAIFHRMDDKPGLAWAQSYLEHETCQKYVATREYLIQAGGLQVGSGVDLTNAQPPARSLFMELKTQISRYARVKYRDRLGAAVLVVQPILLAVVMWIVFPVPTPPAMFMLCLSSLWFGMSSSVRELISDRPIWRRERRVGARLLPYLGAKAFVLGGVVLVQCVYLVVFLFLPFQLGDHGFSLFRLALVQGLTGLAGMALGLLVSASVSSSEAAVGTLPLLLVPQITFSAIMVPLRWMGPVAKFFTWLTIQRYSFNAALVAGTHLEKPSVIPGQWERYSMNGPLYELGFKSAEADDMGISIWALCLALGLFILLQGSASVIITRLRDRESA